MIPEVYVLTQEFEQIGVVNQLTSIRWCERINDFGDFTLWCPLTPENAHLLQKQRMIWIGTDEVGIIETIQKQKSTEGDLTLEVEGRFNDIWLARRIIWNRYTKTDYVSNHMRNLVYDNLINPALTQRRIAHTALIEIQPILGPQTTVNVHRDILWDYLKELGQVYNLAPRIVNNVPEQKAEFKVFEYVNRSKEQNKVDPVVLSSDLSDIMSFSYTLDETDYKNVVQVAGAGEEAKRKEHYINNDISGYRRIEMLVDARDISDTEPWDRTTTTTISHNGTISAVDENGEITDAIAGYYQKITTVKVLTHPETGETRTTTNTEIKIVTQNFQNSTDVVNDIEEVPFPDEVYQGMLHERGLARLADNVAIESFNSQVRIQGPRAYTYGEDYFLGDTITLEDKDLQIEVTTNITEVEQTWDNESHSVYLTFGRDTPTIKQLIRREK